MSKRRKLFQFVREKDTEIGKWKMQNLKILFNKDGNPKTAKLIQEKLSVFSESYCKVTKKIIELSLNLPAQR